VDISAEIRLLYNCVWPYQSDQFVLFDQMVVAPNQYKKQLKGFGSEADGFAFADQNAFDGIQAKGPKLIEVVILLSHDGSENFLTTIQ
jgi:hypothetical protein